MNFKKKYIYILAKVLFALIPLIMACDSIEGLGGASANINESKKRKMFVQAYCLLNNPFDSLNIKEAFIERSWGYGKTNEETYPLRLDFPGGAHQFCIKIEEGMLDLYHHKYNFFVLGTKHVGFVRASILCDIDSSFIRDTIKVNAADVRAGNGKSITHTLTFIKCEK